MRSHLVFSALSLAVFAATACQVSNIDKFPDPGHVTAHVSDQNGAAVAGATVNLLIPGSVFIWRGAVTDGSGNASPGETDGGIIPGDYNATVAAPAGYSIPSTQTLPVPITVRSNKTINLSFKLSKP